MNPNLSHLHRYPFEKLAQLKTGCQPTDNLDHISLSIGEPKHPAPDFALQAMINNLSGVSTYPLTKGTRSLREAIARWLIQRFNLKNNHIDPDKNVLPVNGTREALFAIAQTLIDSNKQQLVFMPNPFYQIYEGAAMLARAEPRYLNTTEQTGFLPDFDSVSVQDWQRCQLLYICSPGNPTGRVMPIEMLVQLIELADKYNFTLVSDECYSELYFDEARPPVGLLEAAVTTGNTEFKHCLVFHSLSKRSNLPGLRSGFVAGDADLIQQFFRYRTYHGCAMPPHHQAASIAAWSDEQHVVANRELYREKFDVVIDILKDVIQVEQPDASFYLWPQTPIDDELFCKNLYTQQNVTVLPGKYLSRNSAGMNPGANRIRLALVAELEQCRDAAQRIREFIENS
ncbi:N-succinyl-L,L-diaminopimelate aminotransferase, type 2 [hydrothermal vent metagenome]|uniref:N-succinyl-L,L-diaminopimelate aminotransferase, type 2 n=1 Tax=hydrothermal vent metagenome TaxID=652676 RepID=A0A3B0ZYX2_9ZZZZ